MTARAAAGPRFALLFVGIATGALGLAGLFPVWVSIVAVFLFAGPHNWFEARYMLGRLPARTGKLWPFFSISAVGVIGLTVAYATLPHIARHISNFNYVLMLYAAWNTLFLFWIAVLVWMRSRTNPRFNSDWVWPAFFLLCAGVWAAPALLNVLMVYLHPCMALVLLDQELGKSRPQWRKAFRLSVLFVPLSLVALWFHLKDAPSLPEDDPFTLALSEHSGAWYLPNVSTHFLVAAHTYLELLHYAVWVVLMPILGMRSWPWDLRTVPVARRGGKWAKGVAALLLVGVAICVAFWVGFAENYLPVRSLYFTVATLHVLAEVPFLLRML